MINNLDFSSLFVGLETPVPVFGGTHQRYINLDNAASTPSFKAAIQSISGFLDFYASVHRGTGFKSQLSTHVYEEARRTVLNFVGADPLHDVCIFGKNTTEAINKLAKRFPFAPRRNIVLVSKMEHHSNDLPWRAAAEVHHIDLLPDGRLDMDHFDTLLHQYADRIALVAVTGGSNVTGWINPIDQMAEKAHAIGAQIFVDCAQLAPHRKVDMKPHDNPQHIDFVAISAHKLYAPFGSGALVGPYSMFSQGAPDMLGGGEVEIVTLDDVAWSSPPERDEAGSPNTVGAVALAAAISQLEAIGMDRVAQHEVELTAYALKQLKSVKGLRMFGSTDPNQAVDRLGVIPFQMEGVSHFLLAAILGNEFGIGVRNGCFCAHPYILHLLEVADDRANSLRQRIFNGDRSEVPGLVRISFGLYNQVSDIDCLVEALHRIVRGDFHGQYVQDKASGEYHIRNWSVDYSKIFSFDRFIQGDHP